MCILVTSVCHSRYPFILVSNRDEFFRRKTAPAHYHGENRNILSPLDLGRPERGTWIGVTKKGKVTALVNYREPLESANSVCLVSRGELTKSYLESDLGMEDWEKQFRKYSNEFSLIGGFSLLLGQLEFDSTTGKVKPFNVISNRGDRTTIFGEKGEGEVFGLSNSLFSEPWPKVKQAEIELENLIQLEMKNSMSQEAFVDELFGILSENRIPTGVDSFKEAFVHFPNSIFIPPVKSLHYGEQSYPYEDVVGDYYGTRTQTVILMTEAGEVHYYERNLHSSDDLDEKPSENHFKLGIPTPSPKCR